MRYGRRLVALVAACLIFSQVASPPANAVGAQLITGTATLSPGLAATPNPQTFTMTGTATGVFGANVGTCNINMNGTDTVGSLAAGLGSAAFSCTGGPVSMNCSATHARVGANAILVGDCGDVLRPLAWYCYWVSRQTPPALAREMDAVCFTVQYLPL